MDENVEAVAAIIKSRFDFLTAAQARKTSNSDWTQGWDCGYSMATGEIGNRLAELFEAENPSFDRERFLTACGL